MSPRGDIIKEFQQQFASQTAASRVLTSVNARVLERCFPGVIID